jgi:hypothetical protein
MVPGRRRIFGGLHAGPLSGHRRAENMRAGVPPLYPVIILS